MPRRLQGALVGFETRSTSYQFGELGPDGCVLVHRSPRTPSPLEGPASLRVRFVELLPVRRGERVRLRGLADDGEWSLTTSPVLVVRRRLFRRTVR